MNESQWINVAALDDIPFDKLWPFERSGKAWVLVRSQASLSAFVDLCSHQAVKLSEFGEIKAGVLICHAHGAAFRCDTGQELCFPATQPLQKARLKVDQGMVYIFV